MESRFRRGGTGVNRVNRRRRVESLFKRNGLLWIDVLVDIGPYLPSTVLELLGCGFSSPSEFVYLRVLDLRSRTTIRVYHHIYAPTRWGYARGPCFGLTITQTLKGIGARSRAILRNHNRIYPLYGGAALRGCPSSFKTRIDTSDV